MTSVWNGGDDLYERYRQFFQRLGAAPADFAALNRFDQIHAGGLPAARHILDIAGVRPSDIVLELGGGLGGVARFIAGTTGARVISLDYSWSYSLTGRRFSADVSMTNVDFVQADAASIPLRDRSVDCVWLQHIGMNVPDKAGLVGEARRIVKNDGCLVYHEWFISDGDGTVVLPLPWADSGDENHLVTLDRFLKTAGDCGLSEAWRGDDSDAALSFYRKLIENKAFKNPLFAGRDGAAIFGNAVAMLEQGVLRVVAGKLVPVPS